MPPTATRRRLRPWVAALLSTLPVCAVVAVLTWQDWGAAQAAFDTTLQTRTVALAMAVDQERQSSVDALDILANSDPLQRDDVVGFFGALAAMPHLGRHWRSVFLVARNGDIVLNTEQPLGQPLGALPDSSALKGLLQRGQPVVTEVGARPGGGTSTGILVPVRIRGQVAYALGAWLAEDGWQAALDRDAASLRGMKGAGHSVRVVDAQGHEVARLGPFGTPQAVPAAGHRVELWAERLAERLVAHLGPPAQEASARIGDTGWQVLIRLPTQDLRMAQLRLLGGAAAVCLLSWLTALWLARRALSVADGASAALPSRAAEAPPVTPQLGVLAPRHLIELARAAEHVGFFHVVFDDGRASWTPGLSRLLGMGQQRCDGRWQALTSHLHPQDRRAVHERLTQALAQACEQFTLESRLRPGAGDGPRARWLSCHAVIAFEVRDGARRPVGVTGMVVDATEQKHLDQERATLVAVEKAARLEAEQANRAKDEFLAMLGHELRNPLGAIAAASEVLDRAEPHDEVALRARQIIARQTKHLARLMDDMLDVFRVISGKVMLVRCPLRLGQVVQRVVHTQELAGQFRAHHLSLHVDDAWVHADSTRIEQVVTNLLSNALKYTPAGGEIAVSVRAAGGHAVLEVRDSGVGMSPELMGRVFDMFVQGERAMDRPQGGLGIGLTLVRRLTELHGGEVEVHSDGPDRGCVFTVRLPLAQATEAPGKALARAGDGAALRVVVVEDNEDARDALCAMLALCHHDTFAAPEGQSGLDLILEVRPDVALIDIGLPGLTGYQVAQRLRSAGYPGRLIALSGYGQPADVARARQSGFNEHLVKPVDAHLLDQILSQATP